MTETIQQLKEDIAILQEKLRKLEEQEPEMLLMRQGKVDIVDYDGKKYFRIEYTDSFAGEYRWYVRNIGEDAVRPVWDVNVYAPLEELYQKEVVKQKEDYPYKKYTPEDNEWKNVALEFGKKFPVILPYSYNELSPNLWYKWAIFVFDEYVKQRDIECGYTPNQKEPVSFAPKEIKELVKEGLEWCEENPDKDPLDYLTLKTPEETEQSLKEAFREAQQTEKWKEIQKLIDEEDNVKNFKNSLDLIKEWGEKNKPKTLYQLIEDWWSDIFCANSMDDMETCIDGLVSKIDKEFIPPSNEKNGYEWEKCLKIMRDKLR